MSAAVNNSTSFCQWLESQVRALGAEIAASPFFNPETKATAEELNELKKLIVVYRFLEQELQRRNAPVGRERVSVKEVVR